MPSFPLVVATLQDKSCMCVAMILGEKCTPTSRCIPTLNSNARFLWPSHLAQASVHKCSNVFLLLVDTSSFFTESGTLMCTWKIRTHLEADRCECIHLSNHYPLQALYSNCLVCVHQLTSLPQCWARLPLHEAEQ